MFNLEFCGFTCLKIELKLVLTFMLCRVNKIIYATAKQYESTKSQKFGLVISKTTAKTSSNVLYIPVQPPFRLVVVAASLLLRLVELILCCLFFSIKSILLSSSCISIFLLISACSVA